MKLSCLDMSICFGLSEAGEKRLFFTMMFVVKFGHCSLTRTSRLKTSSKG